MGPHNQSEGVRVPCADVINLVGLDSYDASSAGATKHWVAPISVDHTSREGTSYKVDSKLIGIIKFTAMWSARILSHRSYVNLLAYCEHILYMTVTTYYSTTVHSRHIPIHIM